MSSPLALGKPVLPGVHAGGEVLRDRAGGEQLTHPGCTQNRRSQKGAAMHVMFGGPAGVGVLHGNPSDL